MVVLAGGERCERGIFGSEFFEEDLSFGERIGNVVRVAV